MRQIICNVCRIQKQEIEFFNIYFKKKYKQPCKECLQKIIKQDAKLKER